MDSPEIYGTEEGFRHALVRANRMRLRSFGATASCLLAVVAVTAGLSGSQNAAPPARIDIVTPLPSPTQDLMLALPASSPAPVAPGSGPSSAGRSTRASSPDGDAGSPAGHAPRRPQSTGLTTSFNQALPTCGVPGTQSWCFERVNPVHQANGYGLDVTLCANHLPSALKLSFPTSAEIDLALRDARGRTVWSYLGDHPSVATPHSIDLPITARCVRWKTIWNGRSHDGVKVPFGEYVLRVRLLASSPADVTPVEIPFVI